MPVTRGKGFCFGGIFLATTRGITGARICPIFNNGLNKNPRGMINLNRKDNRRSSTGLVDLVTINSLPISNNLPYSTPDRQVV